MSATRRDYFVTGTDTGVGKTVTSTALLHAFRARGLRAAGFKPVASGSLPTPAGLRNDDALALLAESSRAWPYEVVNPFAFEPAIAPHLAASEAGVEITIEPIRRSLAALRADSDVVVVEGAGGFLVPLAPGLSLADLPTELGLEVLLVVGLRLGCLNHAFLTADAVLRRGLRLAGWVGNRIDPGFSRLEENLAALGQGMPCPCIGVIDPLPSPGDIGRVAAMLDDRALRMGSATS